MSSPEARDFQKAEVTLKSVDIQTNVRVSIQASQCAIAVLLWPTLTGTADAYPAMIINDIIRVRVFEGDTYCFDLEGRFLQRITDGKMEPLYPLNSAPPKMLAWRTWHSAWKVLDPRVSALLNPVDDAVEEPA